MFVLREREGERAAFWLQTSFDRWHSWADAATQPIKLPELVARAERMQRQHDVNVRRLLWKLEVHCNAAIIHDSFILWRGTVTSLTHKHGLSACSPDTASTTDFTW